MPSVQSREFIHRTAEIHPTAELGEDVSVGAGVIIGPNCRIGDRTSLAPHSIVVENTTIGADNVIHAGAVLGGDPQDRSFKGVSDRGQLIVGDRNIIREYVTLNRGVGENTPTRIGSDCFFLAYSHVGHNAQVADRVTMINSASIGGHARVGEGTVISANGGVHQFCDVGEYVMFQAGAAVGQHVPPYVIVHRVWNQLGGINVVGLRRSGKFSRDEISEIRSVYRALFRSSSMLSVALERAAARSWSPPARRMIDFMQTVLEYPAPRARGVCSGVARPVRAARIIEAEPIE